MELLYSESLERFFCGTFCLGVRGSTVCETFKTQSENTGVGIIRKGEGEEPEWKGMQRLYIGGDRGLKSVDAAAASIIEAGTILIRSGGQI